MDTTRRYIVPLCCLVLVLLKLDGAAGDATISLEFIKYENREGTGNNGHCCDGKWGICQPNGCDHMFTICLDNLQSGNGVTQCPYGRAKSDAINNQDIVSFGTRIGNLRNPAEFHVRGPLPPGFKLKVSVDDKDMITSDFVDLIVSDIYITDTTDQAVSMRARTSLSLRVKVRCDTNFYGDHCGVMCTPGQNYYCDKLSGERVCREGFSGRDCREGICSTFSCHHGGTCSVTSSGSPKCLCTDGYLGVHCEQAAANINDCDDINKNPNNKDRSGVYEIRPRGSPISFMVYCKMQNNRGWTVIQRRIDGSVNFNRNWTDYETGFGELGPDTELWLGLEKIHYLTAQRHKNYMVRIDMEDHYGEQRHADYGQFSVEGPNNLYKLHVGSYQGNAGDGLKGTYNGDALASDGNPFSTYDRDNDEARQFSCAERYASGWWFGGCARTNLNGLYLPQDKGQTAADCESTADRCVAWMGDRNPGSLSAVQMMLLPV